MVWFWDYFGFADWFGGTLVGLCFMVCSRFAGWVLHVSLRWCCFFSGTCLLMGVFMPLRGVLFLEYFYCDFLLFGFGLLVICFTNWWVAACLTCLCFAFSLCFVVLRFDGICWFGFDVFWIVLLLVSLFVLFWLDFDFLNCAVWTLRFRFVEGLV